MGKFISGIVGVIIFIAIVVKVVALFTGGSSRSDSMQFYFGNLAEKMTIEEFDNATGTDGGQDIFYRFTASDKVIEGLLEKIELRKFEQDITHKIVRKNLYTLPDWFAPTIEKDAINILYPDYYGLILIESVRTVEDPEDDDKTIEQPIFYFGAAGKHLKLEEK